MDVNVYVSEDNHESENPTPMEIEKARKIIQENLNNLKHLPSNKNSNKINKAYSFIVGNLIGAVGVAWFLERFLKLGSIVIAGLLQLKILLGKESSLLFFLDIKADNINNISETLFNQGLHKFDFLSGEAYQLLLSHDLMEKIGLYIVFYYLCIIIFTLLYSLISLIFKRSKVMKYILEHIFSSLFWGFLFAWTMEKILSLGSLFTFRLMTLIENKVSLSEIFTYTVYIPKKFDVHILHLDISLYYVLILVSFMAMGIIIALIQIMIFKNRNILKNNPF